MHACVCARVYRCRSSTFGSQFFPSLLGRSLLFLGLLCKLQTSQPVNIQPVYLHISSCWRSSGITDVCHHIWIFCVGSGDWTQACASSTRIWLTTSLALQFYFLLLLLVSIQIPEDELGWFAEEFSSETGSPVYGAVVLKPRLCALPEHPTNCWSFSPWGFFIVG